MIPPRASLPIDRKLKGEIEAYPLEAKRVNQFMARR